MKKVTKKTKAVAKAPVVKKSESPSMMVVGAIVVGLVLLAIVMAFMGKSQDSRSSADSGNEAKIRECLALGGMPKLDENQRFISCEGVDTDYAQRRRQERLDELNRVASPTAKPTWSWRKLKEMPTPTKSWRDVKEMNQSNSPAPTKKPAPTSRYEGR